MVAPRTVGSHGLRRGTGAAAEPASQGGAGIEPGSIGGARGGVKRSTPHPGARTLVAGSPPQPANPDPTTPYDPDPSPPPAPRVGPSRGPALPRRRRARARPAHVHRGRADGERQPRPVRPHAH